MCTPSEAENLRAELQRERATVGELRASVAKGDKALCIARQEANAQLEATGQVQKELARVRESAASLKSDNKSLKKQLRSAEVGARDARDQLQQAVAAKELLDEFSQAAPVGNVQTDEIPTAARVKELLAEARFKFAEAGALHGRMKQLIQEAARNPAQPPPAT